MQLGRSVSRHALTAGMILALASAMGFGQAPVPAPDSTEMTAHEAPITFTTKVNMVMVPVVVRDHKGHAVGNLSQQDFQLFDQGKPQLISRFAVERSDLPPVTAVVATNEAAPAQTAPAPEGVIADRFVLYLVDDIYMEQGDLIRVKLAAKKHLAELSAGTRVAIMTTSGEVTLDFTADLEKLQHSLDQMQRPVGELPGPVGTLAAGSTAFDFIWSRLEETTRILAHMPGSRNLVFISPGFIPPDTDRPRETALIDQAIRSNVIINTLQGRGLYATTPFGNADGTGQISTDIDNVLAEFANNTGGQFFHNDNGLKEGLDLIATRPEYIYVLGFSPQNLRYDGLRHSLRVAVKGAKDFDIQARLGYVAPFHGVSPEETAKEEIREAVFSLEESNDFPVDLKTQFFKPTDTSARLTVLARLDLSHVRFEKVADRNNNIITLVSGIFDRDGHFVKGIQRVIDLKLRDESLTTVQSGGITVRTNFDLTPGTYTIRVVVRDAEGQQMAARNGVAQIP